MRRYIKAAYFWQLLNQRSAHQWFVWADCDALYMNLDTPVHELLAVRRHSLHGGQSESLVVPPYTRGSVSLRQGGTH